MVEHIYFLLLKQCPFVSGDIIDNIIFDTPFDEIQLRQCRMNFLRCSGDSVRKLLGTTKWVE